MKEKVCGVLILSCSQIQIANSTQVFVQSTDATAENTINSQIQSIKSLSGKGVSSLTILPSTASRPAGCVVFSVSSSAAVYLYVKGRVDIDGEIAKASKKIDKAKQGIERQNKILNDDGYKEKVSKELQEIEAKKLADFETEVKAFEETIKQFEVLKLE